MPEATRPDSTRGAGKTRALRPGEGVTHRYLWLAVLVTFVVGDVATTTVGLQVGAQEANSVVAGALHTHGVVGILAIKAAFCAACYGAYRLLPSPMNLGIPSGLVTLGTIVTVWNLAVIGVAA